MTKGKTKTRGTGNTGKEATASEKTRQRAKKERGTKIQRHYKNSGNKTIAQMKEKGRLRGKGNTRLETKSKKKPKKKTKSERTKIATLLKIIQRIKQKIEVF